MRKKMRNARVVLRQQLLALFGVALLLCAGIAAVGVPAKKAAATTPPTVNFQARLMNAAGALVPDGNYNVEFKIYSVSSGGTALWTEDWLVTGSTYVRVANGYLTASLGANNAFSNAATAIPWGTPLWLTMNIGGTAGSPSWDGEMSPRLSLTSVPSAMALTGNSGANTATLRFATTIGQDTAITLPDPGASTATVCYQNSASCGFATGTAGSFIQNGTAVQSAAKFNIVSDVAGSPVGKLQAAASATAPVLLVKGGATPGTGGDVLALQDSSANALLTVGATGTLTVIGGLSPDVTTAASGSGSANGITVQPGSSGGASSNGAGLTLKAGDASGTTSVTAGTVAIQGGNATGGSGTRNGGSVTVDGGTGATANGSVTIGGTNAAAVNIGHGNITTTVTGNATFNAASANSVTINSDLSTGARSTPALQIVQLNDATNNNTSNLLKLQNGDSGSTAAALQISNVSAGKSINITGHTTGTAIDLSASNFTTGIGINGDASTLTSGSLIAIGGANAGATAGFTGSLIQANTTRTLTGTSITDSGNFLNLNRANTVNSAGNTFTVSGALATLQSNCTQTAGTCTDTSTILNLSQLYANASGTVLNVSGAGTGNLATLDATNASANGVRVDVQSNSSSQFALNVTSNNGGTNLIYARADGRVGIGNAAPTATFDVTGSVNAAGGAITLNQSSNNNTSINTGTSTGTVSIGNSAAGAISLQSGGTLTAAATNFNLAVNGAVTLNGGQGADITTAGATTANNITIKPGTSSTSNGPALSLQGGDASGTGGVTGGTASLLGGNATGGSGTRNGGSVNIDAGTGANANGAITIGTTNATGVTVGKATGTTTLQGTVDVSTLGAATGNSFTLCRDNTTTALTACDSSNTTGKPFLQGGNNFGAVAVLGTQDTNNLQIITNNITRALFDQSNNLYLGNGTTAGTPNSTSIIATGSSTAGTGGAGITLQGGAGASATTGSAGGTLTFKGGNAGGTGNNVGGNILLQGGTATGTGVVGSVIVRAQTDTNHTFMVQNSSSSSVLIVDTQNSKVGINLGGSTAPASTLEVNGTLRVSGSAVESYVTPLGTSVDTKINVPNFNVAAYGQVFAFGVPSASERSSRAITIADARTVVHQPSLNVLSPNENQAFGLSWNGSNTTSYIQSSGANFSINASMTCLSVADGGAGACGTGVQLISAQNQGGVAAVGIGMDPTYNLDVNGDANVKSGGKYRIGGVDINTAGTLTNVAYLNNNTQTFVGANIFQPNSNVTGVVVKQTSTGSPTADIFNVQTANGTNVLQVTGPSANNAAVTLASVGTGALTLQGAAGVTINTPSSTTNSTQAITIQSGSASSGSNLSAGTVTIDTGTKTGSGSAILNVGNANATSIQVGNSNTTTTITGTTKLSSVGSSTANSATLCRDTSTFTVTSCDTGNTTGKPFLQSGNNFGTTAVLGTQDSNNLQIITNNIARATFDQSNNLYLGLGATAATPTNFSVAATGSTTAGTVGANLTIQGGAGASATTGSAGGQVTVQGGTAAGTGNNAGGQVTVQGGTAVNTGTGGLLQLLGGAAGGSGTNGGVTLDAGSGASTPNGTINIGTANSSTINIGSVSTTVKATTIHIGDTSDATNPQVVVVGSAASNANTVTTIQGGSGAAGSTAGIRLNSPNIGLIGTNPNISTTGANTLTIQTGGAGNLTVDTGTSGSGTVALGDGNAATINIGRGGSNTAAINIGSNASAHTIIIGSTAGASATTIQAGTGNMLMQTNSASAAVQVRSSTNSSTAFQVQNAALASELNVDTTDTNLILNSGGEVAFGTEWAGYQTGGSVSRTTTAGQFYNGVAAVSVTTGTTNTAGGKNNIGVALTNGTPYVISFWAKLNSGAMTDLQVGISKDGTTGTEQQCGSNFTLSTTTWKHFSCTVTPSASGSTSAYVFFRQANTGTSRTFFIDNIGLTATTNTTTSSVKIGGTGPTTIFTLDQAAAAPVTTGQSAYLGSMYYNTVSGHVQCYEDNGVGGSWGDCGNTTLQQSYTNSTGGTTPEILLDSTRFGVDIQDTNGGIGSTNPLFAVRGGTATNVTTGSVALFTVTNGGSGGSSVPLVGIGTNVATRALDIAVNNSTVNAPPLLVEQAGSGDSGIELKPSTANNSFYVDVDASNGNAFTINSYTAATSTNTTGTFGQMAGTNPDNNGNFVQISNFTASLTGNITSIAVDFGTAGSPTNTFSVAVYADNGSGTFPSGNPLGSTTTQTISAPSSGGHNSNVIVTSPIPVTSGTTYWLAFNTSGNASFYSAGGQGATSKCQYYSGIANGTWGSVASWGVVNTNTSTCSFNIQATVNQSGSFTDTNTNALFALGQTGQATFRNSSNSTAAFLVQNATTANTALGVDTTNNRVGIALNAGELSSFDLSLGGGANRTIGVNQSPSSGNGSNLTLQAGQANTTGTGGLLTLQGGAAAGSGQAGGGVTIAGGAAGTGNAQGGNLALNGGQGAGTQTGGTISLTGGTGGATGAGGAITITGGTGGATSGAGGNATLQGGTAKGATAGGTAVIQGGTAAATAGSTGGGVTISTGSGSSTGTGGAAGNILLAAANAQGSGNNAGGSITAQLGAATGTGTQGTFQVQNAVGASLLTIDPSNTNASLNLIANGGAETGSPPTSYAAQGTGSSVATGTGTDAASGTQSAKVTFGTSQNAGVKINFTTAPTASTTVNYIVSFSAKLVSGSAITPGNTALQVIYSPDNGTTLTATCSNYTTNALSTTAWTKVSCTFVPGSTTVTTALLIIRQADTPGVSRIIDIDNVSVVQQNSSGTQNVGDLKVGGSVSQGLTLLTLDTYAGTPFSGTNSTLAGSMYFDTTAGKIQCYDGSSWGACGAAPNTIVTLTPEYTGAVLHGTPNGTDSNIGTLTSDFCGNGGGLSVNTGLCASGEARNFYNWTSPQSNSQSYTVYVTYKLPSTFKGVVNGTTTATGRVDNTTNAGVAYSIYKSTGSSITSCSASTNIEGNASGSANVWNAQAPATDPSTCSFAANNYIIFAITVTAKSNANAYLENLNFTFTNQ